MVWFGGLSVEESFGGDWDTYLLLLGGPFAAAVMAKGITVAKINPEDKTKSLTSAAKWYGFAGCYDRLPQPPKPRSIFTNDAGDTSLADAQYVVFSLVALAYFAGSFVRLLVNHANRSCAEGVTTAVAACVQSITLPQIPSALLGLTSVAALTYVGSKAVQTAGVRFESVSPNPVQHGVQLTFRLVNVSSKSNVNNTSVIYYFADGRQIPPAAPTSVTLGQDGFTTVRALAPETPGEFRVVVVSPEAVSAESGLTVT